MRDFYLENAEVVIVIAIGVGLLLASGFLPLYHCLAVLLGRLGGVTLGEAACLVAGDSFVLGWLGVVVCVCVVGPE